MSRPRQRGVRWLWVQWVRPLLFMALAVGSFRSAFADWNDVPSGSMRPSILEGDRILVNRAAYDLRVPFTTWSLHRHGDPQRGDIVVLFSPHDGTRLVKRVVGIPGDTLAMRRNVLRVNGQTALAPRRWQRPLPDVPDAGADRVTLTETLGGTPHPVSLSATAPSPWSSFAPLALGAGQYFVMGDNRDDSLDSRWFGPVPRDLIVGRAVAVAASVDPDRSYRPRWRRFFLGIS